MAVNNTLMHFLRNCI